MVGASQLALSNRLQTGEFSTEAELLAACRRRDMAALEQLYLAHAPRLKSIAFHILRNRQDSEDAVQETFVKLYRGIESFMGQANIGTWLCRIVINASYDLARKRGVEQAADLPADATRHESRLPLRLALDQALRRVNPRHRMVFLLFEVEGLRHSEIASILEIPEGTSKAWLFEAKKELKRILMESRP
jgi:RNA polymerase sigma-70 factor (ECF subfamily)